MMGYKDKDKQRAYQLAYVTKRRDEWIAEQGGVCATCGSDESLEVDHIDPALKTMYPRAIWSRTEAVRIKELANCQVLCSDCHKAKTKLDKFVQHEHGTKGRYVYGCRCRLCKTANAARSTEDRRKARMLV